MATFTPVNPSILALGAQYITGTNVPVVPPPFSNGTALSGGMTPVLPLPGFVGVGSWAM